MRFARIAGAGCAAVLAVGTLTACQTHVGAAAYVNKTRISESTVGKYVSTTAKISTQTDSSTGQTVTDNPKTDVLSTLIVVALVDQIFATLPSGQPTASQLDAARQAFLTSHNLANIGALEAEAEPAGFTKPYASLYLDESAKIAVLGDVLKDPGDGSVLTQAVAKLNAKVSVSPRYGKWDAASLGLSPGPATPSFLTTYAANASDTGVSG